jgi:hypothetical protein
MDLSSPNDPFQNIEKSLWKAAKLKSCQDISLWHQSIANAIWWALETSQGKGGK